MFKVAMSTLAFALLSGCPKPQPPVMAQLAVPTVRVNGDAEVTSDGLIIAVTPIAIDNVRDFPQIAKTFLWTKTTPGAEGGTGQSEEMKTSMILLPLPSFQVRITNNTGHVIRLTTAVLRLENSVGKKWQTFSSIEELGAWNMSRLSGDPNLGQAGVTQILNHMQAALGGLQLLTRSVELLKGDEWTGYLAFNYGSTTYDELMNNTERFTLRMAELPVGTNEAGQVSKTTEFTFVFDKATQQVAVVCPPGTTEPSWTNGCKRQ